MEYSWIPGSSEMFALDHAQVPDPGPDALVIFTHSNVHCTNESIWIRRFSSGRMRKQDEKNAAFSLDQHFPFGLSNFAKELVLSLSSFSFVRVEQSELNLLFACSTDLVTLLPTLSVQVHSFMNQKEEEKRIELNLNVPSSRVHQDFLVASNLLKRIFLLILSQTTVKLGILAQKNGIVLCNLSTLEMTFSNCKVFSTFPDDHLFSGRVLMTTAIARALYSICIGPGHHRVRVNLSHLTMRPGPPPQPS